MTQSAEYPDLKWVEPKAWTKSARESVQLIVIHTTEGSARGESAEDGAAYDARRTDGTSTHYFHDSNSTVQCVLTKYRAHTARSQGNRRGIHHELCTRAGSANWYDQYHTAMLKQAAKQAARDAKKWGIPVRRLNSDQVADGMKGFCGHVEITYAFPADKGSHTDPGKNFPWAVFLDMVRDEMAPPVKPAAPAKESGVAFSDSDKKYLEGLVGDVVPRWTEKGDRVPSTDANPKMVLAEGVFYVGATARRAENAAKEAVQRAEDANTRLSKLEGELKDMRTLLETIAKNTAPGPVE